VNKKILLVGTVSNVAKTIEKELKVVLKALSVFNSIEVFLVESDSTDETVKILEKIALINSNVKFIALGKLKEKYPHIPVILDSKRGDIGSTADHYAKEVFERYGADAVTVSPYMGFDTIEPYLKHAGKGVIVLCRTSNPGGSDLQSLNVSPDGQPLYLHVAKLAAQQWNSSGQISLVVGATFPEEIAKVRAIVGDMPLLIPGIGAQGGDIDATIKAGSIPNQPGIGMMINSSRAILYASTGNDFAEAARKVAIATRDALT
jgi:orotidine-5'-phosphate decarboxylase